MEKSKIVAFAIIAIFAIVGSIVYVQNIQKNQGDKLGAQTETYYYGGIVPHHLLADSLITDFFRKIERQNPTTIILIGPNHKEIGSATIITSDATFDTPKGILHTNSQIINQISLTRDIEIDNEIVQQEHSISALAPYIKAFTKDAKIVPLVVSNQTSDSELQEFANTITPYINNDTIVVGAFDFSHFLKREDANLHNEEILNYIEDRNYNKLLSLDSTYTDSPAALVLFLRLMENQQSDKMHVFENTNSGILFDDPYVETTSYFEIGFTQ